MNVHIILIMIVAIVAIAGIVSVKYLGDGNPIEKIAEEVIKEETGLDVNLTPSDTKSVSNPPAPSLPPSSNTQANQKIESIQSEITSPQDSQNTPR